SALRVSSCFSFSSLASLKLSNAFMKSWKAPVTSPSSSADFTSGARFACPAVMSSSSIVEHAGRLADQRSKPVIYAPHGIPLASQGAKPLGDHQPGLSPRQAGIPRQPTLELTRRGQRRVPSLRFHLIHTRLRQHGKRDHGNLPEIRLHDAA